MNPIEQLKSVLCDPEGKCCIDGSDEDRAIVDKALQALAQPEQEPVALREALAASLTNVYVCGRVWDAWHVGTMTEDDFSAASECDELLDELVHAVAPPPQRKPLTDDEIWELAANCLDSVAGRMQFARAIEAAHGIKENT